VWTTVYDATSLLAGTDDGSSSGFTNHMVMRQRFHAADLAAAPGTQARVTLLWGNASGSSSTGFLNVWFGQAGASNADFTGNQVHLTFSGINTCPSGLSLSVTSDPFTLGETFDNTKDYVLGSWTENTLVPHLSHYQGASGKGADVYLWYASATDYSGVTHPSAGQDDFLSPRGRSLAKLEIFVADATISLTAAQTIPAFGQTATASAFATLTAAESIPAFAQSATVTALQRLTATQTIPAFAQAANAAALATLTASQVIPRFTQTFTATNAAPHETPIKHYDVTGKRTLSSVTGTKRPATVVCRRTAPPTWTTQQ
jgi:hypothetical protein